MPADQLEGIADREIEYHIADIRGALEVPIASCRLPGSSERYRNIDAKHQDGEVKAEAGTGSHGKIFQKSTGKNSTRTARILPQGPDISKVRENRPPHDVKK